MGLFKKPSTKDKDKEKDKRTSSAESVHLKNVLNKAAPLPANEKERIAKLLSYNVLDTPEQANFDELTELASKICGTPIALISLIDKDRQWFKSRVGLPAQETSRESSFCAHAILHPDRVMVVRNTLEDERFAQNELVLGFPNIRFYAGAPLITPDGFAIGTLCAIDTSPREFTEDQQRTLQIISHQVVAQLEVAKHVKDLQEVVVTLQEAQKNLQVAKEVAELSSVSSFENLLLSPSGVEAFYHFLQQEFCAENFEFWRAAKTFRSNFSNYSETQAQEEARQIMSLYILHDGPKQVNIPGVVGKELRDCFKKNKVYANMFEAARKEAFELMKRDSYGRFLARPQYSELMNAVRHIGMVRLESSENN